MQDEDALNIGIFVNVQLQQTFANDKVWMRQICQGFQQYFADVTKIHKVVVELIEFHEGLKWDDKSVIMNSCQK